MRRNLLLILEDARFVEAIVARWEILQRISPRVFTVEIADGGARSELAAIDGVRAVLAAGDSVTEEMRRGLTTNESIFVDAYTRRKPSGSFGLEQFVFMRTQR